MSINLPRVTEILKYYTNYDKVPSDILEKASARGTTIHAICAGLAKGAWIPDGMIQEDYLPYVNSFRAWSEAQVENFEVVEKRYQHASYGYTGQVDFVIRATDDKLYLVDLKTSAKPQKTYPIQMAAYNLLLKASGLYVEGALIVYLPKTGDFPNIHFMENFDKETEVFISALTCYKYFNTRKKNDKST